MVPESFVKKEYNNKNFADLVLTEVLKPGIIRAWAVKSYNRNKPAFVNELVKAVKGNDAQIDEIGMNAMTYLWKSSTCDEPKKDLNNFPIRCFLKYVVDDNNPDEEAKKFRNDLTRLLNLFDYKYKTVFEYGGDFTTEESDIAAHALLSRDVHKY